MKSHNESYPQQSEAPTGLLFLYCDLFLFQLKP